MCKPCRKKVMICFNESESIKREISKLTEENQQLKLENSSLKEKLEKGGVTSEIGDCMSRLVVNTESLHQKIYEVKDEIVNTVINLYAGGNEVNTESLAGKVGSNVKKNVLTDIKDEIINTMVNLHSDIGHKTDTYAAVTKKKNVLIVKSTDSQNDAVSRKCELAKALKDVQAVNTKFTGRGNVVMNFANEQERERAANVISGTLSNVETGVNKVFAPKIMICNVSKEESKDDLVEYLIAKNSYLQTIEDVQDKIKLIFNKPAQGNTVHYIIKCTPEIRELIHSYGDVVCLQWGRYTVRDRYHVFNCYFCQRYGHTEQKCNFKKKW